MNWIEHILKALGGTNCYEELFSRVQFCFCLYRDW
jgi:hypothetical protein